MTSPDIHTHTHTHTHHHQEEEEDCFIGIDVGTQGTKAVLYHPHTQTVLGRASKSHLIIHNDNINNGDNVSGRAEQDPAVWIEAVEYVLNELVTNYLKDITTTTTTTTTTNNNNNNKLRVKGIGVSGQQHGMVVLDEHYDVIRPAKLWCDVEAVEEAQEFSSLARKVIPPGFTAPKVMWLLKHEPEHYRRMRYCCLPHDYVNFVLTGKKELTTDAGDASGTGIFDTCTREFDLQLARAATKDEKYASALPRVLRPMEIAGTLSEEWKLKVNLDPENLLDIKVSAGSGDNMCSAMGSGCLPHEGKVVLSLGTSGTLFASSSKPVLDTSGVVAPFCDATGAYLPLICVMSCTGVLQEVLENWCGMTDHDEAAALAQAVKPGCNGVNFVPFLNGERTPNLPHASGVLAGIQTGIMKQPGLIYRSALEGITFNLKQGLDQMIQQSNGGLEPSSLLVVGGGSKNKLWRQIIANVFQLKLQFPMEPESAALGAAFQAGAVAEVGGKADLCDYIRRQDLRMEDMEVYPTEDEAEKKLYREAFDRHAELVDRLFR